eukprot:6147483-Amphidinium_carterae.1
MSHDVLQAGLQMFKGPLLSPMLQPLDNGIMLLTQDGLKHLRERSLSQYFAEHAAKSYEAGDVWQDNLSYELGEEKYSDAQVNDPYAKAFIGKCQ